MSAGARTFRLFTPDSARAVAQFLADPGRLADLLAALRERRPTEADHAECIRRAHAQTNASLSQPAPAAPPPADASTPAAETNQTPPA